MIEIEKLKKVGWVEIKQFESKMNELVETLSSALNIKFLSNTDILTPKTESKKFKSSLSGNFGLSQFPYHTDGAHYLIPPRYIILRDLSRVVSKSSTLILDPRELQNELLVRSFFEDEVYFVTGGESSFYTTIINKTIIPNHSILRYNNMIMKRLNAKSDKSFNDLIQLIKPIKMNWTKKYKTIIIDNWSILHGRENVDEKEINTRRLERTYLFDKKYHE